MNDDQVVQKILKLLENNTAFIGYALNGGIGTKINVRNTETGKTIQALSINVDSTGEVLVVKDSEDNQYKAVTFKTAEKVSERIIQLRKTKPVDDKKTVEYTDSDIEVFYLFVKLIDTGSPVPTDLTSTWIRKGNSCTQFVGAYERCNYASKETIGGVSYTGLPYKPYTSLNECLNDDLGRDAKTPHGTSNENGASAGWKYFSTRVSARDEARMRAALESHDAKYNTNYKRLFGYGSILECSGAMNLAGWEAAQDSQTGQYFTRCEFSYLPGYTTDCTPAMQAAGYCDSRGFINSKCPLPGQEQPNMPSVGGVDNSWGYQYGWKDLPYEFMYKRHFGQLYLQGSTAPGAFYILEVNDDQVPSNLPPGYFPWVPGCPTNGQGGPYDGSGGNRFPDGVAPIQKRDMKLSTHKAEIWLGSSKKETAIKLYELGASDLFSGMYNAFMLAADETQVDKLNRVNSPISPTTEEQLVHDIFYQVWNKNIIDLRIDPKVFVYVLNNVPKTDYYFNNGSVYDPYNYTLQNMVYNIYNRTINLTVIDNKTQIIHLKLGLKPASNLSNTDCKGSFNGFGVATPANDLTSSQSWEYQKFVTIKVKNWQIESQVNNLDLSVLPQDYWKTPYIGYKYFTSFGDTIFSDANNRHFPRDIAPNILLCPNNSTSLNELVSGNHFEQYNYTQLKNGTFSLSALQVINDYYISASKISKPTDFNSQQRAVGRSTQSWWELWDRTHYNNIDKRLSTIVGYTKNYCQVLTNFGLDPNLDYVTSAPNRREIGSEFYYTYLPNRPLTYISSNTRSIRNRLVISQFIDSPLSQYRALFSKSELLRLTGSSIATVIRMTLWSRIIATDRVDNKNAPFIPSPTPSGYYYITEGNETKSYFFFLSSYYDGIHGNRRLDTRQWWNTLWVQFLYDGFIELDIDSYKDTSWKLPTNPSQYIKYAFRPEYTNSEYSFGYFTPQDMETVLSLGTQDVFKSVKMTKPTNIGIEDPNMSFLVYIYPFCKVIKKKKEI